MREPEYQPITLPSDWRMQYHDFRALDPDSMDIDPRTMPSYFREDLFQAVHTKHHVLIDMGWYPSGQANGTYRALLLPYHPDADRQVAAWHMPIGVRETTSRTTMVTIIEQWATAITQLHSIPDTLPQTSEEIHQLMMNTARTLTDTQVHAFFQTYVIQPMYQERDWEYGKEDARYPCWIVLDHKPSNTVILFSIYGFGPFRPWGIARKDYTWFGMDSEWFDTLEEAIQSLQQALKRKG